VQSGESKWTNSNTNRRKIGAKTKLIRNDMRRRKPPASNSQAMVNLINKIRAAANNAHNMSAKIRSQGNQPAQLHKEVGRSWPTRFFSPPGNLDHQPQSRRQ
jgi:hypothetical protein